MDVSSIIQSLGAAAAGGVGSLVAAIHSAKKDMAGLKTELELQSVKLKKLSEDMVLNSSITEFKQKLSDDLKRVLLSLMEEAKRELDGKIEALKRNFRFEIDNQKEDLDRKLRDLGRASKTEFTDDEVLRRMDAIDRHLDKLRDEQINFVRLVLFNSFSEEQSRRWNEINRILGTISGALGLSQTVK